MKKSLAAAALAGFVMVGAQARGGGEAAAPPVPAPAGQASIDLGDWNKPLGTSAYRSPATEPPAPELAAENVNVVDAHWMALTMWGEARSHGEPGLRAVGHVIHNRWKANGRYGAYVTDTVSQAYQFSCWNRGDPNRAAMLNVDSLPKDSYDYLMWMDAKRIANEILGGGSEDPTGGALFYHTTAVAPKWSHGVAPIRQIGNHLFFLSAR